MSNSTNIRRFRINPVEGAIFAVVSLIFANSVYNLFYDNRAFNLAALKPMEANPVSEGRAPASVSQSFQNVDIRCEGNLDQDTGAAKIRLNGKLCGTDAATDATKLVKAVVVNGANKFNATVFTDTNGGKFSTDYIPLNGGKNPIHMEFIYRSGKTFTQDFTLTRAE